MAVQLKEGPNIAVVVETTFNHAYAINATARERQQNIPYMPEARKETLKEIERIKEMGVFYFIAEHCKSGHTDPITDAELKQIIENMQ